MSSPVNILVTGASGQLGQLIVQHLLDLQSKGDSPSFKIIAGTRNPAKIESQFASHGVEIRKVDFNDASTLEAAFQGVDRLVLISTDAVGQRYATQKAAIDAAVKAGVTHIAYTSAGHPAVDRVLYDEHYLTESYLATGIPASVGFSIFRNSLYQEVLLHSLPYGVQSGVHISATGDGKRSYVSRSDEALALVHGITDKFAGNNARRIYEITSNQTFTSDELISLVSEVLGKPLKHSAVSNEKFIEVFTPFVGAFFSSILASMDTHTREGFASGVTNHFELLVGRNPHPLKEFLIANKEALLAPPTAPGAH